MGVLSPIKNNKYVNWVWFIALLAAPIVLWILPSDFFNDSNIVVCPSRSFFDIECWGCGITRAVMHFHHFQFEDAAYFNWLVFVIYPLLVVIWFTWTRDVAKKLEILPNNFKLSQPNL